jgi:hypothetical protein
LRQQRAAADLNKEIPDCCYEKNDANDTPEEPPGPTRQYAGKGYHDTYPTKTIRKDGLGGSVRSDEHNHGK